MDKVTFIKGMVILGEAYEKEVGDNLLEVYYQFLNHLTPEQLEKAARRHIARSPFFPKVSDLLQAVLEDSPSAIDLWNRLISAAADGQEKPELDAAGERALAFIGGWHHFKYMPYDDLKFRFKDFKGALLEGREKEALCELLIDRIRHPQLEG